MITDDGVNSNVSVQALNSAGEPLSIVSDPVQVNVTSDAIKPKKRLAYMVFNKGQKAKELRTIISSFPN